MLPEIDRVGVRTLVGKILQVGVRAAFLAPVGDPKQLTGNSQKNRGSGIRFFDREERGRDQRWDDQGSLATNGRTS